MRLRNGLCKTFTNRVIFGPDGCRENGSRRIRSTICFGGQIMISHLNGSCRAIAARSVDSLTSSRITKVPTAPMFTTPELRQLFCDSCRLASIGATDVDRTKKHYPSHYEVRTRN